MMLALLANISEPISNYLGHPVVNNFQNGLSSEVNIMCYAAGIKVPWMHETRGSHFNP